MILVEIPPKNVFNRNLAKKNDFNVSSEYYRKWHWISNKLLKICRNWLTKHWKNVHFCNVKIAKEKKSIKNIATWVKFAITVQNCFIAFYKLVLIYSSGWKESKVFVWDLLSTCCFGCMCWMDCGFVSWFHRCSKSFCYSNAHKKKKAAVIRRW